MSDLTITKEKNPEVAQFIEHWRSKYQRAYDFSNPEDQATFYEGCLEMARHIATTNWRGSLAVTANTDGVSGVAVQTDTKPTPDAA